MGVNYWVQPEELGDYANTQYADEAAKTASYLLWAMSGRKYTGTTIVTERYTCTLRNNRMGPSVKTSSPILFGGDVYNIPTDDYDEYSELMADGMSPDARIKLRGRPVLKIHSIRNKYGKILDPSNYYLVDHSTIHIVAGTPWTPCNTEITYEYGAAVPMAGKMAARTLATEFAKLWAGDEECMLPQRVTSVSRQGVSYTILDNQEFIDELRTGLYAVDLFLKTTNPDNARRKSKVFSVDNPRARRYTPKAVALTPDADYDLVVVKSTPAVWDSTGTTADLSNFFPDSGWVPKVTLYNYSGGVSVDLDSASITLDNGDDTLAFTVSYDKAFSALGMVDPGTWTLFATKTIAGVENIVEIASGNLQIKLYS
jgi:hypothetical protein